MSTRFVRLACAHFRVAAVVGAFLTFVVWIGCGGDEEAEDRKAEANELVSKKVAAAPTLDGSGNDAVWAGAPVLKATVAGGVNSASSNVTLKSVYTDDSIYFLVEWTDPTQSLQRKPWQKQADGSWKQLKEGPSGDENKYYEDKFSFVWNINDSIAGFNEAGCQVTCHVGEAGKPYGNKYTAAAGELGDIWHWKSVRTGPVGQVDDQYLDDTRYDPDKAPGAGRKSDPKTAGGYADNVSADGKLPKFGAKAPPYWILDSEKKPLNDADFKAGDEVPGIVIAPFAGDRGDIAAKHSYGAGKWTVELARKRGTGSKYDAQFTDPAKHYAFGVAVFDNAQVRHSVSGLLKLSLGK
jgi:hypothetical protein